jgi:hypothetical protein
MERTGATKTFGYSAFVALFEELLRVHPPPIFRRSRWWLCTAIAGFICHGMPGYWAED